MPLRAQGQAACRQNNITTKPPVIQTMKTNTATLPSKPLPTQGPVRPVMVKTRMISRIFILKNRRGLHWRPAMLLAHQLQHFSCAVTVESNGAIANGRKVFELLSLAAGYKTKLTFVLEGTDADKAMATLQALFRNNFAEAYHKNNYLENSRTELVIADRDASPTRPVPGCMRQIDLNAS